MWHMIDNHEFTEFFTTGTYALPGWASFPFFVAAVRSQIRLGGDI